MQKKIKIQFDPFDKKAILQLLEEQLRLGYALKEVSEIFGIMTFESTYEKVRYAVRNKKGYRDDFPQADGWTSKGEIGIFRIFSTYDNTIEDYPLEDMSEKDLAKKSRLSNLLLLAVYFLLCALSLWLFFSKYLSSIAALFEMQLRDIVEPICLILTIYSILGNILSANKPRKPMRNPSWFKTYILPWILIPAILAVAVCIYCLIIKSADPKPAKEAPFQAPVETAKIKYTFLGQIITAQDEFMYIARNEKISGKLYEEAQPDNHDGRWFSPSFWNFDYYRELDTSNYKNIDKALLMDNNHYNLTTQGILVLIDNRLYGIAFDKETTTAEILLNQLDQK